MASAKEKLQAIGSKVALPVAGVLFMFGVLFGFSAIRILLSQRDPLYSDMLPSGPPTPEAYVVAGSAIMWLLGCFAFLSGVRLFKWARAAGEQKRDDRRDPSLRSGQK